MHFFGRFLKYLLRSLFSIIIFLLFIGWAKMGRNMGSYVTFLNATDRSVFHRSQPATWVDPFWSTNQVTGDIQDILDSSSDADMSGLDVYDPAFEQEFNDLPGDSFSGDVASGEEDFGFVSDSGSSSQDVSHDSSTDDHSALLDLIKQHELKN